MDPDPPREAIASTIASFKFEALVISETSNNTIWFQIEEFFPYAKIEIITFTSQTFQDGFRAALLEFCV